MIDAMPKPRGTVESNQTCIKADWEDSYEAGAVLGPRKGIIREGESQSEAVCSKERL